MSALEPCPKFQIEDIAALFNVHLHFGLIDDVTRCLGACAPLSDVWMIERTVTMAERPAWSHIFRDRADDNISSQLTCTDTADPNNGANITTG
jgi:hypothetical protein